MRAVNASLCKASYHIKQQSKKGSKYWDSPRPQALPGHPASTVQSLHGHDQHQDPSEQRTLLHVLTWDFDAQQLA